MNESQENDDLSILNPEKNSIISINTLELPSSFTEGGVKEEEAEKTLKN